MCMQYGACRRISASSQIFTYYFQGNPWNFNARVLCLALGADPFNISPALFPPTQPFSPPPQPLSVFLPVSVTGSVTRAGCQRARCQILPALGMWWAALYLRETDASDHLLGGLLWAGRLRNGRGPAGFPLLLLFQSHPRIWAHTRKHIWTHRHKLVPTLILKLLFPSRRNRDHLWFTYQLTYLVISLRAALLVVIGYIPCSF